MSSDTKRQGALLLAAPAVEVATRKSVAANKVHPVSQARAAVSELRTMLHSTVFERSAAVTLTMKKRAGGRVADSIAASSNFRHFRNRLEKLIFGNAAKRHGKKLKMVSVLETSADHRLHYHCIIDRPAFLSFSAFAAMIRECWMQTDFGYHQINIQDQANAGWTDYILKQRQKQSLLDSIDWDNCHLTAE